MPPRRSERLTHASCLASRLPLTKMGDLGSLACLPWDKFHAFLASARTIYYTQPRVNRKIGHASLAFRLLSTSKDHDLAAVASDRSNSSRRTHGFLKHQLRLAP